MPSGVRLTELLAALSFGADLGLGHPTEHVLRQTYLALSLAERLGMDDEARTVVHYTSMLAWLGCHVDAHEQARWFGDDEAFKHNASYLDVADAKDSLVFLLKRIGDGQPFWRPPGARAHARGLPERTSYAGPEDSVARSLDFLLRHNRDLGPGTFVFVVSDFLVPPPAGLWQRALSARWDPVPVVVQDPTWERSFPDVGGVVLPVLDPADGTVREVRLRRAEARARRIANEERFRLLLARFARLGLDPVVLEGTGELEVVRAFLRWAERRRLARRAHR